MSSEFPHDPGATPGAPKTLPQESDDSNEDLFEAVTPQPQTKGSLLPNQQEEDGHQPESPGQTVTDVELQAIRVASTPSQPPPYPLNNFSDDEGIPRPQLHLPTSNFHSNQVVPLDSPG